MTTTQILLAKGELAESAREGRRIWKALPTTPAPVPAHPQQGSPC